jgi:tRNA threonylcarbamoyladenosine biosynthesis protein TsaE
MISIEGKLDDLDSIIIELSNLIEDKKIVLLKGNLASGKTTFVKAFAKSKNIKSSVTSPTFSMCQNYGDLIFHYDLYNFTTEKFLELGLFEQFDSDAFHFIEWADEKLINFLNSYEYEYLLLEIINSKEGRVYKVQN